MKIGFIGLGTMGLPMARRLLAAGHEVVAWNRDHAKLASFAAEGAEAAGSPREVMARADLVGICLTSDVAVGEIAFGEHGLFSTQQGAGKVVADFSTGSAEAARRFAERAAAAGAAWVDAPVSGGAPAAVNGTLVVMAGGHSEALAQLEPLFAAVSSRVTHMGPAGSGQLTKLCNQLIVSCSLLALAETIALGRRIGIDVAQFPAALKGGFADSSPLQLFGPRMAEHQFEPVLGALSLMRKDVGLALGLAQEHGATAPLLELANRIYTDQRIDPAADLSALIRLFEDRDT